MGALIDSSVLIESERGRLDFAAIETHHGREAFSISAITASELLHGVHRAINPTHRARRQAFVEALLARMPVLPFDLVTARIHAELWARLAKRGARIGEMDLIISATAMAWDLTLITCDERSFPRVPGLRVEVLKRS